MMSDTNRMVSIPEMEINELSLLACRQCDWSFWIKSNLKIANCPHCFSQQVDYQSSVDRSNFIQFQPEIVITPSLDFRSLDTNLSSFMRGIPFKSSDLTITNINQRKKLLFLPMWLVDCAVSGNWEAEIGYNYQVISHQDSYSDLSSQWKSQEVTEQRTRWEKRIGKINRNYDNIPTPALEDAVIVGKKIGSPQFTGLQQYSPDLINHSPIRLPDRSTRDAWSDAFQTLSKLAANDVKTACSADFIRNFQWQPEINQQNYSLLLYPVFSSYYLDDNHHRQVIMIHGQTGKIAGPRKASMKKARSVALVFFIISILAFLTGLITGAASMINPILTPLAVILIVISGILGLGGFFVIGIAWQYNRSADG